jgi:hypothetical protein
MAARVGLRELRSISLRSGKWNMPDRPAAQFNGGAGRIGNTQEICPKMISQLGGIGGVDLNLGYAGGRQAPRERLQKTAPEPHLVDQAVEPPALAMVPGPQYQPLSGDGANAVMRSQKRHLLCKNRQFVSALIILC